MLDAALHPPSLRVAQPDRERMLDGESACSMARAHARWRERVLDGESACSMRDRVLDALVRWTLGEVAVSNADPRQHIPRVGVALTPIAQGLGDAEMAILTNLLKSGADAVGVAELYRKRWTLETMFQALTHMLRGEIDTPRVSACCAARFLHRAGHPQRSVNSPGSASRYIRCR
jgi:hypothetical protein